MAFFQLTYINKNVKVSLDMDSLYSLKQSNNYYFEKNYHGSLSPTVNMPSNFWAK